MCVLPHSVRPERGRWRLANHYDNNFETNSQGKGTLISLISRLESDSVIDDDETGITNKKGRGKVVSFF